MTTRDAAPLNRGHIFIVTLLALFTAGSAVSMRAATAVHIQAEYLDPLGTASAGERLATVLGAAFAGFAITLLLVSAVLAKIGFGRALAGAATLMTLGFAIVAGAGSLGLSPYSGLLIGMVVQGLGWGLVETVINPLTSALYPDDRVGRLGILHAWYPAGLVGGALFGLAIDHMGLPWRWNMAPLALLCAVFGTLALRETLPPVSASTNVPVTPREMISASLHKPTIFLWVILMMFTASTEFAPGQWLDVALSQIVGLRGILVLAYVSGLMFVMRHFAGPLVRLLGNIGLLISSSVFATLGLVALGSADSPATVLGAATVWGFGVAYFWPTMLATVAERYPRSGTMVFGLMGSAGAACTYVVLPYLGQVYDGARLAAQAQGHDAHDVLTAAAAASFRAAALIPLCLIVIFIGIAIADRMRKRS
jgi:MFS family permease